VSLRRVNPTASRITAEQLSSIRKRIMVAVGAA
jgi:mRNA interferase MazF